MRVLLGPRYRVFRMVELWFSFQVAGDCLGTEGG